MKKIILVLFALLCCHSFVWADDISDVKQFFNNYVKDANSYSSNILNYYLPNAKIIRVVYKKNGEKIPVNFPMSAYSDQLKKGAFLAKTVGYTNKYTNITVKKLGKDEYGVYALRTPMRDKVGLPFHFIVIKTEKGYKVKEESMATTVQKFLDYQ